jgi:predicted RNA binding protein YcfA (HicA-like mRNA interferase family)
MNAGAIIAEMARERADGGGGRGDGNVKAQKILERVLAGSKNISFADTQRLVEAFGFRLSRISGSHHIYSHPDIRELVNLQDAGGQAKPYQIRQFLKLVEEYNLKLEDNRP